MANSQVFNDLLKDLVNKNEKELLHFADFVLKRNADWFVSAGFGAEATLEIIGIFVTSVIATDGKYTEKEKEFCQKLFGSEKIIDGFLAEFDGTLYSKILEMVFGLPDKVRYDMCVLAACVVSCDREISPKEMAYLSDILSQ